MKNLINTFFNTFLKAIAAGLCIGLGGIVYLSSASKLYGAVLFSIGLLIILIFKLKLFTGACGYFIDTPKKIIYGLELIVIWLGNFLGSFILAKMILNTRLLLDTNFIETKLTDSLLSLFILSICCGLLMYVGVVSFNSTSLGPLIPIMCVTVFVTSGFEHCVADMFYFSLLPMSGNTIIRLLIISCGNLVGSWLLPIINQIMKFGESNAK